MSPTGSPDANASVVNGGTCQGTLDSTTKYTVTPSHGKVFYIDSGQNQNVDASYAGYTITNSQNTATEASRDVWVRVDGFTSDEVVQLANPADRDYQLGVVSSAAPAGKTAFFLLKAPMPSNNAQSHTVRIYAGNPAAGGTEIYNCSYSFSKVRETIKAAANKVGEATSSTNVAAVGGELTMTVKGVTGTIGAGSAPDGSMMWFSPAARSAWPSYALRLTSTVIKFGDDSNPGQKICKGNNPTFTKTLTNTLIWYRPASGSERTIWDGVKCYEATYKFAILNAGAANVAISPIAQISSGTQIKHTDMSTTSITGSTINLSTVAVTATATKSSQGIAVDSPDATKIVISYRVTVANTGSTALNIEQVVDTASSSLTYKSGTAKNDTATAVAITPGNAGTSGGSTKYIFSGPWNVAGNKSLVIDYKMNADKCPAIGTATYDNVAAAQIGSTVIGTNGNQQVKISSTQVCTSVGGTPTLSQASAAVTIDPVVTTGVASNVSTNSTSSTSSATIGGIVDRNGNASTTYVCQYATNASLTSPLTATPTISGSSDPVTASCSLTNLTPGTTYYYRLTYAGSFSGEILSFTTPPVLGAAPVPTTTAATAISFTGGTSGAATLNGTINPNGFTVSPAFDISANQATSNCSSPTVATTTALTELDESGVSTNVQLTGIFATPVSLDRTGLSSGWYCYRVKGTYLNASNVSTTVTGAWLAVQIIGTGAPTATTVAASEINSTTAKLNGTVAAGNQSTTVTFCWGTDSGLSGCATVTAPESPLDGTSPNDVTFDLTGLTPSTQYYFRVIGSNATSTVNGSILNFTTPAAAQAPSVTTNAASSVASTTATLNGAVVANNANTTITFCLSTSNAVTTGRMNECDSSGSNRKTPTTGTSATGSSSVSSTFNATGLTAGTVYYYQIIGVNSVGTQYGSVVSFTTEAAVATGDTNSASNVAETTATLNGIATAGSSNIALQFCYALESVTVTSGVMQTCLNSGPNNASTTATLNSTQSGSPSLNITGLTPGTTYKFQLVIDPSSGNNVYGQVLTFTTLLTAPTATTSAASSLGITTATVNGSSVAGTYSGAVKFCVSASAAATSDVLNSCSVTTTSPLASPSAGASTNHTENLTGLTGGTTYYFQIVFDPTTGNNVYGAILNFTTTAAQNNSGGGGGGGGGGGPIVLAPTPTPTPVPTVAPSPRPRPTAAPSPRPIARPIVLPPAPNTTPAPRVSPAPIASPAPAPSARPTAQPAINQLLADAKKVEESTPSRPTPAAPVSPASAPTNGASERPNNSPSLTPSQNASPPRIDPSGAAVNIAAAEKSAVLSRNQNGTTNTLGTATRTIPELARERVTGFAPAAGLRIEVIGSRIAGQFILAPGTSADPIAVAAAIEESTQRNRTEFASINSVQRTLPPATSEVYTVRIQDAQRDLFAASGLPEPQSLGSMNFASTVRWIQVEATAATYVPGTMIYLTVTSQPIIFGEAVVDRFGKANLSGKLPIDLLENGGHSIRLVGIRSLDGVSTDSSGEIQLTDAAMQEIQRFDDGSQATVIMSGAGLGGGVHSAIREVPLDREIPWWTVWFALISGLILLVVRLWKPPVSTGRRVATGVLAIAAGAPAAVIGWLQITYEVWIGVAIAFAFGIFNLAWKRGKKTDSGKRSKK